MNDIKDLCYEIEKQIRKYYQEYWQDAKITKITVEMEIIKVNGTFPHGGTFTFNHKMDKFN